MIKRSIIIIVLSSCFFIGAKAQDSLSTISQHLLSISTGLSNHMVRDDIISPLIYKGNQLPILLTYNYRSIRNHHTITVFFDNLELTSSITDRTASSHYAKNLNFFLEYSYNRKAFLFEHINTECFLGGRISGFLNWRTFHYSKQRDVVSPEAMMNLAFDALLETKLNKSSDNFLSFHVCMPLISYVLLNDRYNAVVSETLNELDLDKNLLGQIITKGDFVTLNKLFKLQIELSYTMFVSGSVGFEFQYRFLYYSFAQYKNLFYARCINNQLLVGFIIIL